MNKLHIVSLIAITSIFFVNAEESSFKKEILRAATVQPGQTRGFSASPVKLAEKIETNTGGDVRGAGVKSVSMDIESKGVMMVAPQKMMIPTTGDPAIDEQVKVLANEMEVKMKVIGDEYRAKIKAVIGNRPFKNSIMIASGTPVRVGQMSTSTRNNVERDIAVKEEMVVRRQGQGNSRGSGTPQGGQNMQEGLGVQFSNFFRTMFIGNN